MNRESVLDLIRRHLADELDLDPATISESTRFKEDLEADSLDLYTLVQELEADRIGMRLIRRNKGYWDLHRTACGNDIQGISFRCRGTAGKTIYIIPLAHHNIKLASRQIRA